ncbi:hypothetical protein D3C72_2450430 [compost metagenome]
MVDGVVVAAHQPVADHLQVQLELAQLAEIQPAFADGGAYRQLLIRDRLRAQSHT